MDSKSLIEILKLVIQNQEFISERLRGIVDQYEQDMEDKVEVSKDWMDKMVESALGVQDDNPKGK